MAALKFRDLPAIMPGRPEYFMADPRLIVVDPDYNCRDMNSAETRAHIDWLTDSIMANEFTSELHVIRRGTDVVLRRGHCRLAAALKAIERGKELEAVPVILMTGNEEVDLLFDQETSNSGLRLDEIARARLVRKARLLGVADAEIARRMNWKSVKSVKDHLELLEAAEPLKQDVRDGVMSAGTALQLHRDHGEAAPEVAAKAKAAAPTTGKKKGRVTQATVAKVTGKSSRSKTNEHFIDFVAVANKMDDAVKLAGGLDKVAPEKINALVSETITTLARSKGRHVEEPSHAQPQSLPATAEADSVQSPSPPVVATPPQPLSGISENRVEPDAVDRERDQGVVQLAPQSNGMKATTEALLPFARISELSNLDELADDYVHEISNRDVKRAAAAWFKATGLTATGNVEQSEAA